MTTRTAVLPLQFPGLCSIAQVANVSPDTDTDTSAGSQMYRYIYAIGIGYSCTILDKINATKPPAAASGLLPCVVSMSIGGK